MRGQHQTSLGLIQEAHTEAVEAHEDVSRRLGVEVMRLQSCVEQMEGQEAQHAADREAQHARHVLVLEGLEAKVRFLRASKRKCVIKQRHRCEKLADIAQDRQRKFELGRAVGAWMMAWKEARLARQAARLREGCLTAIQEVMTAIQEVMLQLAAQEFYLLEALRDAVRANQEADGVRVQLAKHVKEAGQVQDDLSLRCERAEERAEESERANVAAVQELERAKPPLVLHTVAVPLNTCDAGWDARKAKREVELQRVMLEQKQHAQSPPLVTLEQKNHTQTPRKKGWKSNVKTGFMSGVARQLFDEEKNARVQTLSVRRPKLRSSLDLQAPITSGRPLEVVTGDSNVASDLYGDLQTPQSPRAA